MTLSDASRVVRSPRFPFSSRVTPIKIKNHLGIVEPVSFLLVMKRESSSSGSSAAYFDASRRRRPTQQNTNRRYSNKVGLGLVALLIQAFGCKHQRY